MLDTISYIYVHAWPPIGTTKGAKQLVPPAMPKGIVCVHQQLCIGQERWYIHPILRQGGHCRDKDLQFFAVCPIYLPQLPKLVGLVHVFGQPARPEVVDKRPILGHVGRSPHGYCTVHSSQNHGPSCNLMPTGLGSTVFVVAIVATGAKYHGGQIMVLPTPCTWWVVQWRRGPSKQGTFTPTKGPP